MPNICTKFLIWISSWNDYKNVGTVIQGTRFIAFKVPVLDHPEWNLDELKKSVPELQNIIDLNGNTSSSIFDKGEGRKIKCQELGINYKKLSCTGGKIPSQELVEEFFSTVR